MPKIVHTELMTDDPKATADFINKMFGWTVEKMPGGPLEYYSWNYPGEKTGGGGIGKLIDQRGSRLPYINIYIDVDDLGAALEKAKSLGAEELMGITEIPNGMGYFAVISAPGGITLGFWTQKPSK